MCVCVCGVLACVAVIFSIIKTFISAVCIVCLCLYAYVIKHFFKPSFFCAVCVCVCCVCVCDRERDSFNEFSIVNVFNCQPCISHWPTRGLQPCSWRATSYRFQLQPQSNTPEPANHSLQGHLLIFRQVCWSRVVTEICRTVALQEQGWRSLI